MSYTYTNAKDRLEIYHHNLGNTKTNSVQVSVLVYRELKRLKAIREIQKPQKGLVGIIKGILKIDNLQEVVSINRSEYPITLIENSNNVIFKCARKSGFFKREEFQVHFADDYLSNQSAKEIISATSTD